jgi:hypothetical protein
MTNCEEHWIYNQSEGFPFGALYCVSYCVKLKADAVKKLIISQYETGRRCAS